VTGAAEIFTQLPLRFDCKGLRGLRLIVCTRSRS